MVFSSIVNAFNISEEMRVAIYTGAINNTTFIDNLVRGLADRGVIVYLFGRYTKRIKFENKNVRIYQTYNSSVIECLHCILNAIRLLVCHPNRFCVLIRHIRSTGFLFSMNLWSRYLPVMNHLPDVFHVQWTKSAADWVFLKSLGVKLVLSFRGTQLNVSPVCDKSLAASYKKAFPLYDGFHCVSRAIMMESLKYGATETKSGIVYPAVKDDLLNDTHRVYHPGRLNILSVGRDHWKKGYRVAIEAMQILKNKGVDFNYTIIAGNDINELRFEILQLGLQNYVTLIDKVPHEKVFEYQSSADIFLLPSFEEGVANVVLEAMALGTPVISTDCGGMKEVIADGENGLIVPLRSAEAIADAIIRFSKLSSDEISRMTGKAKKTIREKHLLSIQVEQMMKLYNQVLYA